MAPHQERFGSTLRGGPLLGTPPEAAMPRDFKPTTDQPPKIQVSGRIPLIVGVVAVVSVGFWLFGPAPITPDPVMMRLSPSMP
jgi:hypothetical protein